MVRCDDTDSDWTVIDHDRGNQIEPEVSITMQRASIGRESNNVEVPPAHTSINLRIDGVRYSGSAPNSRSHELHTSLLQAIARVENGKKTYHFLENVTNSKQEIGHAFTHPIDQKNKVHAMEILEIDAEPDVKGSLRRALIHAIKQENEADVTELLRRGADPNARDNFGCALLYAIKEWQNAAVVMDLLERGADPNSRDSFGCALLYAIKEWQNEAIVMNLLERGADPNSRDSFGCALLYAIKEWQNEAVVMDLLGRGADPNSRDDFGCALLYAIKEWQNEAVVMDLLQRGADPNSKDDFGCALVYAARWRNERLIGDLRQRLSIHKSIGRLDGANSVPVSSSSGSLSVNGMIAAGSNLTVSMPGSARHFIATSDRDMHVRNLSCGPSSTQIIFNGSSEALSALLKNMR